MERTRVVALVGLLGLAAAVAACRSSVTSASAILPAPILVSPAAGASIAWSAQPITLVVTNMSGTSSAASYVFEIATDSAFSNKVFTKTVPAGTSGQTSVQADTLSASTTYYWRARVQDGTTAGTYASPNAFIVGVGVSVSAPAPVSPANGYSSVGWPTLTVTNAARTGPTGMIVYKFEIASDAAFSSIVVSATVGEGPGQTSFQPSSSQSATVGTTLYWRVSAIDQTNSVSSSPSTTRSFFYDSLAHSIAAMEGLTLWPGAQPSGTNGHVQIGGGWDVSTRVSPLDGTTITTPTLENLRILDLLDRGMAPTTAVGWLQGTYGTSAVYYPAIVEGVIGFSYNYMAKVDGQWTLVFRVGA